MNNLAIILINKSSRRWAAVLILTLAAGMPRLCGELATLAVTDEPSPAGDSIFDGFSMPVVNASGEVAMHAILHNGAWTPSATRPALFVARAGALAEVVRGGPSTDNPPFGISSFRDASTATGSRVPSFSDRGSMAMSAVVNTPGVTFPVELFRFHPDAGILPIMRRGDTTAVGDATYDSWGQQVHNSADQIAIQVSNRVDLNTSYNSIERVEVDGSLTRLAFDGMNIPGSGATFDRPASVPAINSAGHIAIGARLRFGDESTSQSVVVIDDGGPRVIAQSGDPSPDGNGVYGTQSPFFQGITINDKGQVLFQIRIVDSSIAQLHHAWVLVDGEESTIIAHERTVNPDGGGTFDPIVQMALNNHGQTAFMAPASGNAGGLFLADATGLRRVYKVQDPAPGGVGFYRGPSSTLAGSRYLALNDRGQIAFLSSFTKPNPSGVGVVSVNILVFRDAYGSLIDIAHTGMPLAGSTIKSISFYNTDDNFSAIGGQRSGLGPNGHVAFKAELDDGREGVFLWTPPWLNGHFRGSDFQCGDNAWCVLPWYGAFHQSGRWLRHEIHGWQLFGTVTDDVFTLYDVEIGAWIRISELFHPFMHIGEPLNTWVAFDPQSAPAGRLFFRYDLGEWRTAAELTD
jgi:hypothetical protein